MPYNSLEQIAQLADKYIEISDEFAMSQNEQLLRRANYAREQLAAAIYRRRKYLNNY